MTTPATKLGQSLSADSALQLQEFGIIEICGNAYIKKILSLYK
jgi:hypothetical protein